jgi:hypothetical protein
MNIVRVVIFVGLMAPFFVLAEWSGSAEIKVLKAQTNGIHLTLKNFTNSSTEVMCDRSEFFMREEEGVNYEARLSMFIAAYMASKPVNISYYGCDGELIKVSSVKYQ